jgi:hypothetical protein
MEYLRKFKKSFANTAVGSNGTKHQDKQCKEQIKMSTLTKINTLTKYVLTKLIFLSCLSNNVIAQSVNEIPWSNKRYLKNTAIKFDKPSSDYSREQATQEYQAIRLKYEKDKARVQTQANNIKIYTEGAVEVINQIPLASIVTSPIKEWAYQNLDNFRNNIEENFEKTFNNAILNSFEVNSKKSIQNDNGLTFEASLNNFKTEIQVFKNNLKIEDYQIIAPNVDEVILEFIENNRNEYEERFNALKNQNQELWKNIESDWTNKLKELENKAFEYDKLILEKVKENAEALQKFSEGVGKKFQQQQSDIDAMKKEVKENGVKHENNKKEIETLKNKVDKTENDIKRLNQLTFENRQLINENTYKIDVITDVLYENVNTSGKMKLLNIRYKDDENNSSYQKEKQRLENIQTVEDIKYQLATGKEVLTLANNLGLSDKDYKAASKIIAIGEVLAGGAMAYYTGNPVAGLQAVNGAFSIFGGGSQSNPEFDAIMQQFKIVNQKLDQINNKLDTLNKNLIEFRNLTIDLHQENQKRFDVIEDKLEKIQTGVNNITQLIYAQNGGEQLIQQNISGYQSTWTAVENANSINDLRNLYNSSPLLRETIKVVHDNTKYSSIISKPFLHYNRYNYGNYWEDNIYTPMLQMTHRIYDNKSFPKLEQSIVYLNNLRDILNSEDSTGTYYKDIFSNINWEVEKLIYPQAVVALTDFTSLFEPYFYFSSLENGVGSDFSIPSESILQNNISYGLKNDNLITQFKNVLKENRTAILQTNIMAGIPLLNYIKKHIEEPSFNVFEKQEIYKLLLSENYYLKVNLSNSILYNYIYQQNLHADRLNKLLNCNCRSNEYDGLLKDFNQYFANSRYELGKIENKGVIDIVLIIKPTNITGIELSKNLVILPLPPFEYIYDNRAMYPSYLEQLYDNLEFVTNKVIKYDIIKKMNDNNLINLKLLK